MQVGLYLQTMVCSPSFEEDIVRSAFSRLEGRVRMDPEMREIATDLQRLHRSFDRHLGQMQNGILEVRMVPLGQVFDKLARIVRQISREHDKQVNLVVTGSETEIDKLIVEELSDPLMHMMRNAIDHGIEDKGERMRVGKPPVGTIALNAFQKGNHVVIEVEDDGPGIRPDQLERVFERFYTDRADAGADAFGQNSGLGLSISKQIVEAHRGRIWAENIEGLTETAPVGARFVVELPAAARAGVTVARPVA